MSYWTSKARCIKEKKEIIQKVINDLRKCDNGTRPAELIEKWERIKNEIQEI